MEVAPRRRLRALQRHVAAPEHAAKDSAALTPVQADAGFDVSEAERETIEAHRYLFDLQGVRALLWRALHGAPLRVHMLPELSLLRGGGECVLCCLRPLH